jgi:hypothetical protein
MEHGQFTSRRKYLLWEAHKAWCEISTGKKLSDRLSK